MLFCFSRHSWSALVFNADAFQSWPRSSLLHVRRNPSHGDAPAASLVRAPVAERKVGIAYSTWHNTQPWGKTWGSPMLGQYLSKDPDVIRQHAHWLVSAHVDFIYIDWSNDIDTGNSAVAGQGRQRYLEEATTTLFDEYARMREHPEVAVMIGFPGQPSSNP